MGICLQDVYGGMDADVAGVGREGVVGYGRMRGTVCVPSRGLACARARVCVDKKGKGWNGGVEGARFPVTLNARSRHSEPSSCHPEPPSCHSEPPSCHPEPPSCHPERSRRVWVRGVGRCRITDGRFFAALRMTEGTLRMTEKRARNGR